MKPLCDTKIPVVLNLLEWAALLQDLTTLYRHTKEDRPALSATHSSKQVQSFLSRALAPSILDYQETSF